MYSAIYWLTRLDGIKAMFTTIAVITLVSALAIIIATVISSDFDQFEDEKEQERRRASRTIWRGKLKWIIPVGIISLLLNVFTPNKNEMILIYAGGKAYDYIQTDTSLQKIPYKTTEYLKVILEKQIEEAKDSK
ncbi:MAG TPA: hypothetical protein VF622_13855 [Segetibacter sp.]|jgi:TRAP-type C4-dicarboxylate transport system permease large subunit